MPINVAAYCRVSTDSDDQMNSFENQVAFFNEYIQRNEEWNLVRIYTDEGVTGTNVTKRKGFNKMIEDAKAGKINLILTKEVSRFARNTVDTLHYTRELGRFDVGVIFINDNINTLDGDGEFRLAIMASVAQEESRKTSMRVKWGMKRQMEEGFVFTPSIIGYEISNGILTINEEEAKVVRKIFDLYVNERLGSVVIAKKLANQNTPLYKRIKCWSPTLVMRIIKNEKYVGDLVQQKTIVKDYLTHKSIKNKGDKLVFRDHHEPIIDRATWDRAQELRINRTNDRVEFNPAKHNNKYWCSGKIQCGVCHGGYVTKTKSAIYGKIRAYRCKKTEHYENEVGGCTNKTYIDERILIACMQFAVRKVEENTDGILEEITKAIEYANVNIDVDSEINDLESKINKLEEKKKKLLTLLMEDILPKSDFVSANKEIDVKIFQLKNEIIEKQEEKERILKKGNQVSETLAFVKNYLKQEEPTTQLYSKILHKIVVYKDKHVDIFLIGMEIPISVKYSTKGRGTQYIVLCEEY